MSKTELASQVASTLAAGAPKLEKLKKACKDLEAVFVKDLLTIMSKSNPKSQFGNAPGAEIYEDMFHQAVAESAAKKGSFGLGQSLYRTLAPSVLRAAAQPQSNSDKPSIDLKR